MEELSWAQPGALRGREAQETCLIGPGGRLYHICELGARQCGHLVLCPPQPGLRAPRRLRWDRDHHHPPLGVSGSQRAFSASGIARGLVLCPLDTS